MNPSSPFMTVSNTILWLKVALSVAALVLLYVRYLSPKACSPRTKLLIAAAVVVSFAVFHDLGSFRGGTFLHYGELFHYYLGPKYFKELGHYELYNAVIVADSEQGNALAAQPFYTDLRTYKNAQRTAALRDAPRVKQLFSEQRWNAFKEDVAFFKEATTVTHTPGLMFLLMDHGYNASPVSTVVLGVLTNLVPVTHMRLLAAIDVVLVLAMFALVFRTFGFEMGAFFAVYFSVSILSGHEYLSGSILRYDWLLFIVAAVCLLHKGRYAGAAFFLTLSTMMRIFPAVLFYGIAVTLFQKLRAAGRLDKSSLRFIVSAAATALALFVLPAVSLGSVLQPWKEFYAKTELHDSGVYVNHLGLRGIVLFESSHLSLERFVQTYRSPDLVRRWQDVKEHELRGKRPVIVLATLLVIACVTAIIWRRKESESEAVLWPLLVIYATSYLSTYYYAFLCLFVLLFWRRAQTPSGFVPLCLLLVLNLAVLVTDYIKPSQIVFFTLINIYLFLSLASILGFELYATFVGQPSLTTPASEATLKSARDASRRPRQPRARRK